MGFARAARWAEMGGRRGEGLAEALAAPLSGDGDGAEQRRGAVQLERRGADDPLALLRDECRPEMLIEPRARQLALVEQIEDRGEVARCRGRDDGGHGVPC